MGKVRLVAGAAGSGKTTYILEEIVQSLRQKPNQPIILLVPEQSSYNYEYQLSVQPDLGGVLSVQVLSFQRLAWTVLQQTGGAAKTVLSDLGKLLILRQEILQAGDKWPFLQGSANKPGYLQLLAESIAEFKQYGYSPEGLTERLESEAQSLLDLKLRDFKELYASYNKRLSQENMDSEDMMRLLLRQLPKWADLPQTDIYIDSFDGFTPQEQAVVEKLIALSRSVTVALTLPVAGTKEPFWQKQVFAQTKRTAKALEAAAGGDFDRIELSGNYRHQDKPDLSYLVQAYHDLLAKPYGQKAEHIRVVEAQNITAEVEYTAREIRRLCREEGYHYGDIAIFVRDLSDYEIRLQNTLDDVDIPYFMDRRQQIAHHPLLECILAAIEIKKEHWSYQSVFRYLKSGLAVLNDDEIDRLENYVLAFGIKGAHWYGQKPWRFQKRYTLEDGQKALWSEEDLECINHYRQQVVQPLRKFHHQLEACPNCREMVICLYQLLETLQVPQKLIQWTQDATKRDDLAQAEIHGQIWTKVLDILDQLVLIAGEDALSVADFGQLLQTGFRQIDLGMIPTNLDQVQIGVLQRSRSQSLKAVFLLGVNEGIFPARLSKQGLFTDTERQALAERGFALAPDEQSQLAMEEYLVYIALSRASAYLSCSYALSDDEGKSRRPSAIIRRLKTLFPQMPLAQVQWPVNDEGKNLLDYIDHPLRALSLVGNGLQCAQSSAEQSIWASIYNWLRLSDYAPLLRQNLASIFYDNQPKPLPRVLTDKLYPSNFRLSVSSVEKYRQCPYAHFLQYGLHLQERVIYQLESFDIGQFYHKAMELLHQLLQERQLSLQTLTDEELQVVLEQIVTQLVPMLQNEILLSSSRYQYIKRKLGRTLAQSVNLVALHARHGEFTPLDVEVSFGGSGKIPGYLLPLTSDKTAELVGRIDRIERAMAETNQYLRIIDFKTGSKGLTLSEIYYGLKIQLLVYLDIMMSYYSQTEKDYTIRPAGIFYYFFKNPIIKADKPLPPEVVQQEMITEMIPQGLVLADIEGLRLADKELTVGKSLLLPLSLKKNAAPYLSGEKVPDDEKELLDIFDKRLSSVVTPSQMALLERYALHLVKESGLDMLEGKIAISPCRLKNFNSCQYCPYRAICRFEPQNLGLYRELTPVDDETFWQSIEKQVTSHE